ncbi:MAG: hypothetical protein OXB95_10485, partial [Rhodobacteraceae bacterium]|nr:hypothetical protein [Paracoccaceae bacterium]
IGVDDIAEAATPTAADIELGVTLGGATLKMTYGNRHTAAVPAMANPDFMAEVPELTATVGYDIWVKNPLYDEDATAAELEANPEKGHEFIAWAHDDEISLSEDSFEVIKSNPDLLPDVDADRDGARDSAATDGFTLELALTPGTDKMLYTRRVTTPDDEGTPDVDEEVIGWFLGNGSPNEADGSTPKTALDDVDQIAVLDMEYERLTAGVGERDQMATEDARRRYIETRLHRKDQLDERAVFDNEEDAIAQRDKLDCNRDGETAEKLKADLEGDDVAAKTQAEAEVKEDTEGEDACKVTPITRVVREHVPASGGDPMTAAVPAADDDEWAIGVGFAAGGVDIGVGYDSNRMVNMGVASSIGGISTALYYEKPKDAMGANMGINIGMSVAEGTSVNVGVSRGYDEMGMSQRGVGVGMSHDLGGGATFKFGAGRVKGDTAADAGISMSF